MENPACLWFEIKADGEHGYAVRQPADRDEIKARSGDRGRLGSTRTNPAAARFSSMNRTGFSASTKSSNASGNNKSCERSKSEMCVMADSY